MPEAMVGSLRLEYECIGDAADEPMLLIMGLGMQLTGWDSVFCKRLAAEGYFVIRYDNRDVGLSSRVEGVKPLDLFAIAAGDVSTLPYSLDDLAGDAIGLLDALGIERAHLVGASMGAMIAQLIAIHHPERVRSLASIMGTTGDRAVGQPRADVLAALFAPPSAVLEDDGVRIWRAIGSKSYPLTEHQVRAQVRKSLAREHEPSGAPRHLAAVLASADRTEQLRALEVPTVVIHGAEDPLIDVSGGRATASSIPGSTLEVIDGMAHDFPAPLWGRIIDAIVQNARRV